MSGVLVTGVGGGVGQSILKCLQDSPYRVVAMDPDVLATGLHAAMVAYRGLPANDPDFVNHVLKACLDEGCSVVLPGVEPDLKPLALESDRLAASGVTAVVSAPDVIDICDDKLETARFLAGRGFAVPRTEPYTADLDVRRLPVVLKPRRGGARSQNTYVVHDEDELDRAADLIDPANCVAQEYIEGPEFTAGSVSWGGACQASIVMRRTLRAGDTYKAFVVRDPRLEEFTRAVVGALGPFGACNVQFRLRDGEPYVFEVNARCSGTTYARAMAGFNEPRMVVDHLVRGEPARFDIREVTVLRYWKELAVENERIDTLRLSGRLAEGGARL